MEYIAVARNIKMSPRKVRLVAEGLKRQKNLPRALSSLMMLNKRASGPVKKVIESAMANAVNNHKADKNNLMIKELTVNEGIMYKRYHYAARGRVRPYKKRTSHIRVVLADKPVRQVDPSASLRARSGKMKVEKVEEKKEVKTNS